MFVVVIPGQRLRISIPFELSSYESEVEKKSANILVAP